MAEDFKAGLFLELFNANCDSFIISGESSCFKVLSPSIWSGWLAAEDKQCGLLAQLMIKNICCVIIEVARIRTKRCVNKKTPGRIITAQ